MSRRSMSRRSPSSLAASAGLALLLGPAVAGAQTGFTAQLFGQDAVPPVDTEATGSCVGVLTDTGDLALSCEHDVIGASAAHVHRGFPGQPGPVVFALPNPSSEIVATVPLTAIDWVFLRAGGLYVDVHDVASPSGRIRGQLAPNQPLTTRRAGFPLQGGQVVPPVATDASGACVAVLPISTPPTTLDLECAYDLDHPALPFVYLGPPGVDGLRLYGFPGPIGTNLPGNVEFVFGLPFDEHADDLFSGRVYVEVGSDSHPDGELRGQIPACFAGPTTLCLNDGRFQVEIAWATALEEGQGRAGRGTDDSGTFWFFRPSNLELLVKALDGCGVNGHYWVFFAATTDVGFELTVTDTATGRTRTYPNALGHDAETVLDTAAFDTCP